MSKKQNITVGIDIEAKVDSAQKSLVTLQKSFAKLNLSDAMQSEFSSLFSNIDKELNKIVQKTASGKISLVDVASVQKSFEKIEGLYATLNKKIAQRGIMKSGLQEDAAALSAITGAVKLCDKAIESSARQEEKLNKTLEAEKIKRNELLEKQKLQKTVSEEEILNQKLKLDNAKKLEKAAKKELEQAKQALDAKIAASGGKYTEADITKKGSALRKTDAYKAYKDAAQKYTTASANTNADNAVLKGMVTPAMQAAELKKVEEAIESAEIKLQEFNETSAKSNLADALDKAKKALESLEIDFSEYGVDINDIKSIDDLREALEKVKNVSGKKTKKNLQQIAEGVEQLDHACEGANNDVKGAGEALEDLHTKASQSEAFEARIKDFLGLSGAAQILRSSLRNAMQTITELDATMTEMAVVTDLGVGDYWKQLPEYTARAKELGLAIGDVYKADTLFYQQGLKTNEVVEISTQTMKMAAIAGLDTATATDRMTAALRGFNMELNETSAQKVSDVYSELAAITAADVDEISNAMTKTASIASSAGMEFETTAAFLSQIIETTRESAETAGTAMKTIIARFQELKKAPSEIGEVDGEIVDANKIETALRSVGVALRDSSGQFRELDDVFLELSSKWDGLDKNTQRYIATIAAGSRQQSRFIAMMSDYSRTQELVTAANTSAGASQKQFEKTTESLEYKLNNLKAAWDEFTMGIMNSDLVKMGVDVLTKFLEVVNKATGALDGVGGSLTKIIGIVGLFKLGKKLFDKFADPITKFFLDLTQKAHQGGYDAAKAYMQGGQKAAAEQEGVQTPQNNEAASIDSKTGEAKEQKKSLGQKIGGFVTRTTGFDDFAEARKQQQEAKYWRDLKSDERLKKVYDEKQQQLDKMNKEYTFGEKGQVYKKGAKPGKGTSITLNKEEAEEVKKEYALLNKEVEAYNNAEANYIKASSAKWESVNNGLNKAGAAATGVGMAMSALGGILSEMGLEEFGEGLSKAGNYVMIFGSILSALPAIFSVVAAAAKALGITISVSLWQVTLIVAAVAAVVGIVIGIVSAINKTSPEAKLKAAEESAEKAAEAADEAAESYNKLAQSFDDLGDKYKTLEDLTKGTKEWNKAVREINSSVLELIDEYPELAKFVESKGGVLTIDLDSEEVQDVLQEYEMRKISTRNEAALASAEVTRAHAAVQYTQLEAIDKGGNAVKNNETIKRAVTELAKALHSGEVQASYDEMRKYLEQRGVSERRASILAKEFSDDLGSLTSYGETLQTAELQQQAAFDSIASSAQELADTLGMTSEQIKQSSTLVDGDIAKEFYDKKMRELGDFDVNANSGEGDYGGYRTEIEKAIKQKYGSEATLGKNGKVTYRGTNGDTTVTLTGEEMASMIATQYATDMSKKAIENSDEAIRAAGSVIGKTAFNNLYKSEEGESLRQKDVETLKVALEGINTAEWQKMSEAEKSKYAANTSELPKSVQEAWKKMGSAGQLSYGNDITRFIDDMVDGVVFAEEAFAKAGKVLKKVTNKQLQAAMENLTSAQQKGLTSEDKMEAVYNKGAAEEIEAFESALAVALSGENAEKIAEFLSSTSLDWSDQDQLVGAKRKLIEQYGLEETAANNLTISISNAVDAVSDFTVLDDVFGEFYQTTQKINASMKKLNELQWDYQRLLNKGASAQELAKNQEEQRQALLEAGFKAIENYENAREQQVEGYALGVNWQDLDVDLTQHVSFDPTTRSYNTAGLTALMQEEEYRADTENGKKIQSYIDYIESLNKKAEEQLQIAKDSYEQLEELNKQAEQGYWDLWDIIEQATYDKLVSAIELERAILDATEEGNEKLVEKLQEQINTDRQNRKNTKTEKNIGEMRSRLSYLGLDSSGANALEILELQKTIEETQEGYQDSLIDQSIQQLQDANKKAYAQRERQIALQELQLEEYRHSAEHQTDVTKQLEQFRQEVSNGISVTKTSIWDDLNEQTVEDLTNPGKQIGYLQNLQQLASLANAHMSNVESNTSGDPKEGQGELLSSINDHTAILSLEELMLKEQARAASQREYDFEKSTGYDIMQTQTYTDESGKTTHKTADPYIQRVNSIVTDENKDQLVGSNAQGEAIYHSAQGFKDSAGRTPLSKEEFYNQLNTEGAKPIEAGGKKFDRQNLENWLTTGGEDYGYGGYMRAFLSDPSMQTQMKDTLQEKFDVAMSGKLVTAETLAAFEDSLTDQEKTWLAEIGYDALDTSEVYFDGGLASDVSNWWEQSSWNHSEVLRFGYGGHTFAIDTDYGPLADRGRIPANGFDFQQNHVYLHNGYPYIYHTFKYQSDLVDVLYGREYSGGGLYNLTTNEPTDDIRGANAVKAVLQAKQAELLNSLKRYATGGLADFTGPAWLDGTPSKPEYILNSAQTERFFSLVDVLERFDSDAKSQKHSGDNYFDIEINVEKLENDYDVEQVADKIRRMIYDDAAYRNVNTINHIR